ncbi:hypothetical protein [Paraurantiacibacter namhicola]|uniref:Uncharacterized protein n=1 Tax=Paraurantiacibacter namhicola TaxID=645517 RepID=A0A1C7D4X8_9SPHN|nr:hypothetical protein [Paraurantiacibacter namhicola]ANU06520.1 hypothetical protein A6F65_00193 [Paraurantiacibacter namhicola]
MPRALAPAAHDIYRWSQQAWDRACTDWGNIMIFRKLAASLALAGLTFAPLSAQAQGALSYEDARDCAVIYVLLTGVAQSEGNPDAHYLEKGAEHWMVMAQRRTANPGGVVYEIEQKTVAIANNYAGNIAGLKADMRTPVAQCETLMRANSAEFENARP